MQTVDLFINFILHIDDIVMKRIVFEGEGHAIMFQFTRLILFIRSILLWFIVEIIVESIGLILVILTCQKIILLLDDILRNEPDKTILTNLSRLLTELQSQPLLI